MIACLFVPLFPLAARLRSEPELKGEAVAIFEGNGNAARVVAATRKARRAGIVPGMTLPQARARMPGLVARGRDAECERAASEALLEVAESFSPRIEDAGEGVAYVDLEGHARLSPARVGELVRPPVVGAGLVPALPSSVAEEGGHKGRPYDGSAKMQGGHNGRPYDGSRADVQAVAGAGFVGGSEVQAPVVGAGLVPALPSSVAEEGGHKGRPYDGSAKMQGGHKGRPYDQGDAVKDLARDMIRAAEKAGLPARVGVAASKLSAHVAAGLPDSPTVVARGAEADFLAPLPLEKLAPQLEIAATLDRWGLSTIGELAKLPEGEVASRLGEIGRALHMSARGLDPQPLEPWVPPPSFTEGMDLEWPLATLEPFLFLAHAALERLLARLESRALSCTRLEVTLKLDPDGHDARAIALPAPTRDARTLLTLVRLELEARPPGAPVAGFVFSAHPDAPRRAQLSLFGPAALSPDRLATTIARLAALLGADRVGSPRPVDGHRPERYASTGYTPPPPPKLRSPSRNGRGLLSVRVLRPPVALEVLTSPPPPVVGAGLVPALPSSVADEGGHKGRPYDGSAEDRRPGSGRPYAIKSAPDAAPPVSGSVRVASGPWSLEDGWWTEAPADRDYWDVELSDGGLYRVYRDRRDGAWFADGVYD